MIYLKLFFSFFQIGLFSIGGGYAILPMIQGIIVETNHWLSMDEFLNLVTISQMTPGPIAINASTFVGTSVAGPLGAIVATIGCITPSCIIVLILAYAYQKFKNLGQIQGVLKGLRMASTALIMSACVTILILTFWGSNHNIYMVDYRAVFIASLSILAIRLLKIPVIFVILCSGLLGLSYLI
jgi:chromate transporter